jgi:hypothetical protein
VLLPPPLDAHALLDTGAEITCIDGVLVQQLGQLALANVPALGGLRAELWSCADWPSTRSERPKTCGGNGFCRLSWRPLGRLEGEGVYQTSKRDKVEDRPAQVFGSKWIAIIGLFIK